MEFGRAIMWALGAGLVVVGLFMLLVETGVSQYIPATILVAGVILVLGLVVMGMANRTRPEPPRQVVHTHTEAPREEKQRETSGTKVE